MTDPQQHSSETAIQTTTQSASPAGVQSVTQTMERSTPPSILAPPSSVDFIRKIESLQCIVAQLLAENERLRQLVLQLP